MGVTKNEHSYLLSIHQRWTGNSRTCETARGRQGGQVRESRKRARKEAAVFQAAVRGCDFSARTEKAAPAFQFKERRCSHRAKRKRDQHGTIFKAKKLCIDFL